MQTAPNDLRNVATAGFDALRRGDARGAREIFEDAVRNERADVLILIGLAQACRGLGDRTAARQAVDRALSLDSSNLYGLLLRGDLHEEEGDARAASSFYLAALRNAPPPHELAAELRGELARAQKVVERYGARFEETLRRRLSGRGGSARFQQSLDLVFRKKQVYFQQPRYYYFPELPQIQFYERHLFPWLDAVESATPAIRAELEEVMKDPAAFSPYVVADPNRPAVDRSGMLQASDWTAFYLVKHGHLIEENAARCPATMAAMSTVPLATVVNRSPSVLFSLLRPGARIPPHNGFVNTRLICHLPLIVPGKCTFRVGNDVRDWVEGKAWVFDDTIEHEAWNRTDRTRVVLLFEIWRPELTQEERTLVTEMFEAIDEQGQAPAWEI